MTRRILPWLVALLAAIPAVGGVGLLLDNGDLIEGQEVERKGGHYLLRVGGQRVAIPVELVREVRLTGDGRRSDRAPRAIAGHEDPSPRPLPVLPLDTVPDAAPPDEPPDLPEAQDRPLDPLEVFGDPSSKFPGDVIESRWLPATDWDVERGSDVDGRSRWNRPPIETRWRPEQELSSESDVTQFRPARWSRGRSYRWVPEDGFPKGQTP